MTKHSATDVSIHFTTKGQTVESINKKFNDYIEQTSNVPFDFLAPYQFAPVLHHCFLPEKIVIEKGFDNGIYNSILHNITDKKICWFGVSGKDITIDRQLMLENLAKLKSVAIFIGDIKEGVYEELELVKKLGIEYVLIP